MSEEIKEKKSNEKSDTFTFNLDFLKNKKFQISLIILILLATLFVGVVIRTLDVPHLIDHTNGKYVPLALDPFYWLRVAQTIVAHNGTLPAFDTMRSSYLNVTWTPEILPKTIIFIWHVSKIFNHNMTLRHADVLYPVIAFIFSLLAFFFLIFYLTRNWWMALISAIMLAFVPPYLYRSMAGFADHDILGMFAFFMALLFFAIGMNHLKKKKTKQSGPIIYGLLTGFLMFFSVASWGGIAKFSFLIIPLAFLLDWIINKEDRHKNYLYYYTSLIVGAVISIFVFGYPFMQTIKTYLFGTTTIFTTFDLGFIFVSYFLPKIKFVKEKYQKYNYLISAGTVVVLGAVFYHIFIGNIFSLISRLFIILIHPFGVGRVTKTVAENASTYVTDLVSQIGKTTFYLFLFGLLMLGINISTEIKKKKYRKLFSISFILFSLGILYSSFSPNSILNGNSGLSKVFVILAFLFLGFSSLYIYFKSEWKINVNLIIIFTWAVPMLLALRGAQRLNFLAVPFVAFMAIYSLFEFYKRAGMSKDETARIFSKILALILIVLLIIGLVGYYKSDKVQSKNQSPSYNLFWQKAMAWVRNNTSPDSIFLHWWDYGYWVQTGGHRPTIADGGYHGDYLVHNIGRYVLTTPIPATAKSYMKTMNASYLLIDPSDIGKYSAYSSIGNAANTSDRASWLLTLTSSPSKTQETRNQTIRLYQGTIPMDEDIFYNQNGKQIFLPEGKSYLIGVFLPKEHNGNYSQPLGVYFYNGKQYQIPIEKLFINGELLDFHKGINATAYIYPNIYTSNKGQQLDPTGALMYLSQKTQNSLIAQLYLMGDPKNEYPELKVAHKEGYYPFPFYYGGFQGPLTIYSINRTMMTNINKNPGFLKTHITYGEYDNFSFVKNKSLPAI